jgi:hypothetical protein
MIGGHHRISADRDHGSGGLPHDLRNVRASGAWIADSLTLVRVATISNLEDRTGEDPGTGAVRSTQAADLCLAEETLHALWAPANLERLARTYWRFLSRVTLGLVRVRYTPAERSLVLVVRPLRLLTFAAPEYEMDLHRGVVRWRISGGLLVARRGRDAGYLQIEVRRLGRDDSGGEPRSRLHVEVEVAGFYPAIASGLGRRFYALTQSRIHVLITHGFLRSLARLQLAESRVGVLDGAQDAPPVAR